LLSAGSHYEHTERNATSQTYELNARRRALRQEIGTLARTISINMDTSLTRAENLPVEVIDSQWDELKSKWAELTIALGGHQEIRGRIKVGRDRRSRRAACTVCPPYRKT
jgi:hypothetical protein